MLSFFFNIHLQLDMDIFEASQQFGSLEAHSISGLIFHQTISNSMRLLDHEAARSEQKKQSVVP